MGTKSILMIFMRKTVADLYGWYLYGFVGLEVKKTSSTEK